MSEKSKIIAMRLKDAINSSGLTYMDIEKKSGIPKSAIQRYASGVTESIPIDRLVLICKAIDCEASEIMGWAQDTHKVSIHKHEIKVLGRVAAGIPIEAVEDVVDTEEISSELAKTGEFFGLRIKGDSMMPTIRDGDTVIVRKQDDAETDEVVIAMINGDDATCKRLVKYQNGIGLLSFNPAYPPMMFSNDQIEKLPVKIIGRVVENRQKF